LSVAALLAPRLLTYVRQVFAEESELLVPDSWEELDTFVRRKPVSVVILDPLADGIMNVSAVAGLLKRYPSLPIIAYVTLTPTAFNAIAQLSRLGLEDVILHRFDDGPEKFRERVERLQVNPLTRHVLGVMAPSLAQMPMPVASAVEDMFVQPHRYTSALDLAMGAGVPIVRLYRTLHLANLGSPKKLFIAARLLRGYSYLRDPGYSVLDVSVKLGYRSTRIFAQHAVSVFGITPSRVRKRIPETEAIKKVLDWLRDNALDPALT
jgi:AraC-like DNA-binding protein